MKVLISMIRSMDMVSFIGLMGDHIGATGKKANNMEEEYTEAVMELSVKVNGLMVKRLNGWMND